MKAEKVRQAWIEFLKDRPTRGGTAEYLLFSSGFEAAGVAFAQSAAPYSNECGLIFTDKERAVIAEISTNQELRPATVIKRALATYQLLASGTHELREINPTLKLPSDAFLASLAHCGKNMGNDLLVIPCDLKRGHDGPCERNTWPVNSESAAPQAEPCLMCVTGKSSDGHEVREAAWTHIRGEYSWRHPLVADRLMSIECTCPGFVEWTNLLKNGGAASLHHAFSAGISWQAKLAPQATPSKLPEIIDKLLRASTGLMLRNYANEAACLLWTEDADSDGCGYCMHCVRADVEEALKIARHWREAANLPDDSDIRELKADLETRRDIEERWFDLANIYCPFCKSDGWPTSDAEGRRGHLRPPAPCTASHIWQLRSDTKTYEQIKFAESEREAQPLPKEKP